MTTKLDMPEDDNELAERWVTIANKVLRLLEKECHDPLEAYYVLLHLVKHMKKLIPPDKLQ